MRGIGKSAALSAMRIVGISSGMAYAEATRTVEGQYHV
jgi:hypothetical protein